MCPLKNYLRMHERQAQDPAMDNLMRIILTNTKLEAYYGYQ